MAHLGPFEVGQIVALLREGYTSHRVIRGKVRKADGDMPSLGCVGDAIRRLGKEKSWTGERIFCCEQCFTTASGTAALALS